MAILLELLAQAWAWVCVRPFRPVFVKAGAWMRARGVPHWMQIVIALPPILVFCLIVPLSPVWIGFLLYLMFWPDQSAEALMPS